MFGSSILEVAIGLVFVYLLLSLICTSINEIIEAKLKNRATDLERGIGELFGEKNGGELVERFYTQPLIYSLFNEKYKKEGNRIFKVFNRIFKLFGYKDANEKIGPVHYLTKTNLPSYIPARMFTSAVIDLVMKRDISSDKPHITKENIVQPQENNFADNINPDPYIMSLDDIIKKIDNKLIEIDGKKKQAEPQEKNGKSSESGEIENNKNFYLALRILARNSNGDIEKFRENIEAWFNSSMDRVSGWYTRRTKWIILIIGIILTIILNVNSITIAKRLTNDNTLRNTVVAQAQKIADNDKSPAANFEENRKQLDKLGIPIGWDGYGWYWNKSNEFELWNHLFLHLFGWLLTAAAVSLGAPFWFDVLNKIMVIRSTVKPHEKSLEESSEDRQTR